MINLFPGDAVVLTRNQIRKERMNSRKDIQEMLAKQLEELAGRAEKLREKNGCEMFVIN